MPNPKRNYPNSLVKFVLRVHKKYPPAQIVAMCGRRFSYFVWSTDFNADDVKRIIHCSGTPKKQRGRPQMRWPVGKVRVVKGEMYFRERARKKGEPLLAGTQLFSRALWEASVGEIPKGYYIGFIDGNHLNVDFKNLELRKIKFDSKEAMHQKKLSCWERVRRIFQEGMRFQSNKKDK